MPKWVNTNDDLPQKDRIVLCEYYSGDYGRQEYHGPEDWWKRNVKRWLDESEPSFSIDDMHTAYNTGYWIAEDGQAYTRGATFRSFMKEKYNIDITQ